MIDLSRDPVINTIYNGIKRDINIAFVNKCWRATVLLIYSGMDTMAFLGLPCDKHEVRRADFISWVDRYIKFPCKEQLSGLDIYGARCSVLHTYGAHSSLSRDKKCRIIGYVDHSIPEVIAEPSISKELVIVSITALKNAFFEGIDKFLIDVFKDPDKSLIVEERLKTFHHLFPVRDNSDSSDNIT